MTVYLDCCATTPPEPEVVDTVVRYLRDEYGNEGSRTHERGARAKAAVQRAREQVARVLDIPREDVVFTSGATEANNLALLGLAEVGERTGRRHVVSTAIEHKAVLEPLQELSRRGFEVTLVPPGQGGWVAPGAVEAALRPDTLIVSVQQANNETGILQPIDEIARNLDGHPAYLHVDAAQGFGKDIEPLRHARIDLVSVSGHKLFAPKGVGALALRKRGFDRPPLRPLAFGGGQERGLRPGTLPVPLIAGLGVAAELSLRDHAKRREACLAMRRQVLSALLPVGAMLNGDQARCLPHVLSIYFPGIDSEALMVSWKGIVEVSNGSACTSHSYAPSHVLRAMGLEDDTVQGTVRLSWCHLTETPDLDAMVRAVNRLQR